MRKAWIIVILMMLSNVSVAFAGSAVDSVDVQGGEMAKKRGPMAFSGCSGGMMIHSGYLFSKPYKLTSPTGEVFDEQAKGFPWGMGGALRVHFGKYLRVGMEGYVSNLYYGMNRSHAAMGWGGALIDHPIEYKRWTFYLGAVFGGGRYKHLVLLEDTPVDYILENKTSYRSYSMFIINPFIGFEYALTRKVHFTMKMDYMLNVSNPEDDYATGPRLFVGILFHHPRKN